jgi:hypothetical protein
MEGVTEGLIGISCSWNAMSDRESKIRMNMESNLKNSPRDY